MAETKRLPKPRDMTLGDLDGVAELHRHCFTGSISIFTVLSDDVLKRYYTQFIEEPESFAAILEEPGTGRIVGMTIGTFNPNIQRRFLQRYFFRFLWDVLRGLFVRTAVWKLLWRRLQKKDSMLLGGYDSILAAAGVPAPKGPEALHMLIGVHKQFRGGGNAQRLIEYHTKRMFEHGATRVRSAVLLSNLRSLNFFRRVGWNIKEVSSTYMSVWIDRPNSDSQPFQAKRASP
jgi:ribosomal protein S18 acetylase RimI-like enzyme